jgi:polyribonucleotide nucleotidyltransferase
MSMLSKIEEVIEFADGKSIRFETGRVAKQAAGSVVVQMGDAVTLCTMCYGPEKQVDFFPSNGRIP